MTAAAHVPSSERVWRGEGPAIARAITLAERGHASAAPLLAEARRRSGQALRVGLTGPAGVGKSSLVRELVRRLRARGDRVAVIACDPVSPVSGGAFFGDRYRLAAQGEDAGLFFRSLAHRAPAGEPCPAALAAADILDAAGYPWILLESVGTGQADVNALAGTHVKLLLHSPDAGDDIQMLKAGLLETADLHLVNKCDRPGAAAWAAELESTLGAGAGRAAIVLRVSAATGEGVEALVQQLVERRQARQGGS